MMEPTISNFGIEGALVSWGLANGLCVGTEEITSPSSRALPSLFSSLRSGGIPTRLGAGAWYAWRWGMHAGGDKKKGRLLRRGDAGILGTRVVTASKLKGGAAWR